MEAALSKFHSLLEGHPPLVVLTGAGISTPSGIPDFRGQAGIALTTRKYGMSYEELLSHDTLIGKPEVFYSFYWDKMIYPKAKPNRAHEALASYPGQIVVITQNIDGLHEAAGSKDVVELHGSASRYSCLSCGRKFALGELPHDGVPHCPCGGLIRPDVVLYGEGLDPWALERASSLIAAVPFIIVAGSSLRVYPAAGLVTLFKGQRSLLVNLEKTPLDSHFDDVVHIDVEAAFGEIFG